MSDTSEQAPLSSSAVSAAELRNHDLPGQHLGGYSREATDQLLDRAARALEAAQQQVSERVSRQQPDEHAIGEALVTAHRVADSLRTEAEQEADALLAAARTEAEKLVQQAEHRTDELRAESTKIEDALHRAREEAGAAESYIVELQGEAERIRAVIDNFRTQWWNLITDALRQLEVRLPGAERPEDESNDFARDLRDRLNESRTNEDRQSNDNDHAVRLDAPEASFGEG